MISIPAQRNERQKTERRKTHDLEEIGQGARGDIMGIDGDPTESGWSGDKKAEIWKYIVGGTVLRWDRLCKVSSYIKEQMIGKVPALYQSWGKKGSYKESSSKGATCHSYKDVLVRLFLITILAVELFLLMKYYFERKYTDKQWMDYLSKLNLYCWTPKYFIFRGTPEAPPGNIWILWSIRWKLVTFFHTHVYSTHTVPCFKTAWCSVATKIVSMIQYL